MNNLYIFLLVLLILFLLCQIRIGAKIEYKQEGLFVWVRAGMLEIPVFPVTSKMKKKEKRTAKEKPPAEKKPKGGLLELALSFIPIVLDTVKKLRRKIRVDKLDMHLTAAAADPGDAALQYGRANAVLGSLWQPITQAFHVKDGHAGVSVDFEQTKPTIYLLASLSLTIGQALALVIIFGARALCVLIRTRNKSKKDIELRKAV